MPGFLVRVTVASRAEVEPGAPVAIIGIDGDGVPHAPPWRAVTCWGVAVADGPGLRDLRAALAAQALYVLPGPTGETLYAFGTPDAAERATAALASGRGPGRTDDAG